MEDQQIKNISVKKLKLWTENPRDPLEDGASDFDIIKQAMADTNKRWRLSSFAKRMGPHYDFSELPTVVFHGKTPIVYDGNRRVILAKLNYGLFKSFKNHKLRIAKIPKKLPCNVCSQEVALENVLRKHSKKGSWGPLNRDIFLYKHMKQPKSVMLALEEITGFFSKHSAVDKGYISTELLTSATLEKLGIRVTEDQLYSKHSAEDLVKILEVLLQLVSRKEMSTRKNREKLGDFLLENITHIISPNVSNKEEFIPPVQAITQVETITEPTKNNVSASSRTGRVKKDKIDFFGERLALEAGEVNNLYRDIEELYDYYVSRKSSLSENFSALLRMSLRLLCETATPEGCKFNSYLQDNFAEAKAMLDKDKKTLLSNQNVNENSIAKLLHTGAHNYSDSANIDQTKAISIIVGKILMISHARES